MSDVGKPTGLVKRLGSSSYYCRFRYPSDVAALLGRAEFNQSLKTGDRAEAMRRLPQLRSKFDQEVLAARSKGIRPSKSSPIRSLEHASALTDDLAVRLAQDHFRAELRRLDGEIYPSRGSDEWLVCVEDAERDLATFDDTDHPNVSRWTERAEIGLLSQHQISAQASSPESSLLRAYLRRSMRQIAQLKYARLQGDYRDNITDSLLLSATGGARAEPFKTSTRSNGPSKPGVMLDTTIVDLWAKERTPSQKSIDAHRAVARWLYERAGRKSVDRLTKDDFLLFKSKLLDEGQSAANIKQKLSRLRTLVKWASDNGYTSGNPAQGVTIKDTRAGKNNRLPFDLPALTAIFASPVYSVGERPIRLRGDAGYWLPLLALFTGARLEELGQLRPADIAERSYADADGALRTAWFIHIREDKQAGLKLKNAGSERRVPVHTELERLGFLGLVKDAAAGEQGRLFPLLKPDKYSRLTAKWGENWSVYKRTVCGITDPRSVFHSFRHTFKDYARLAGIPEDVQRQLMGHSSRDVADAYGSGHSDHTLVEAMRRYKVPGLLIPDSAQKDRPCA